MKKRFRIRGSDFQVVGRRSKWLDVSHGRKTTELFALTIPKFRLRLLVSDACIDALRTLPRKTAVIELQFYGTTFKLNVVKVEGQSAVSFKTTKIDVMAPLPERRSVTE